MIIQKAIDSDSEVLKQLFSILYKPELKWTKEKISKKIKSKEKEYYLVLDKKEVLGAFGIKFEDFEAKFGPLAVKPEFQKNKIGSKLLRFAEELTKEKGLKKIWCHSLEIYNAENFYKKNGWKEEEFIKNFWDGQNCFVFSKIIDRKS
ncbi:MAG: GNAT family N-acetyltransferase [Candidatus Woesearchaeota archaeon]